MLRASLIVLVLLTPAALAVQPTLLQAVAAGATLDGVGFRVLYTGVNYGCGDVHFLDGTSRGICIRVSDGIRASFSLYGEGITLRGSGAHLCPPVPGAGGAPLAGRIDGAIATGVIVVQHDCPADLPPDLDDLPIVPDLP